LKFARNDQVDEEKDWSSKRKSDCEPEELCFLAKEFDDLTERVSQSKPLPGGHTEVVPLLPIPNRTVKRFRADDSWLYFQ
jgi:hypothetical protein